MQNARVILLGMALTVALLAAAPAAGENPQPLAYTVHEGDTLIKICGLHRHLTHHYSLTDLLTDIRRANGLESNFLRVGQQLVIPVLPASEGPAVRDRVDAGAEVRGIYLTGPACGVSSVLQRVDRFVAAGGNAVVFDAKDIDGAVSYRSGHPLAGWGPGRDAPVISSLPDMMQRFSGRGLYVIARLALFLDGDLGRRRPDLALQDDQGRPWSERGCYWMDPTRPEVVEYNLALARELALAGVDEIQFDYVRFPTNGWTGDAGAGDAAVALRRREASSGFLAAARDVLHPLGVRVSADLYGIMAWGRTEDLALTGQHVPTIAALVDVICPMIYPSHFGPGFEGRRQPGDDPAYFIAEGTRRFRELAAGQAEIRPWLQAFPYRVTRFDGEYVGVQVTASREAGGAGWCLWNPACMYTAALDVLPGLCPDPGTLLATGPSAPAAAVRTAAAEPAAGVAEPARTVPAALVPGQSLLGLMGGGPAGARRAEDPAP